MTTETDGLPEVVARVRRLLSDGEVFEAHHHAHHAIGDWPDDQTLSLLYALACARAGALEEAAQQIAALRKDQLADMYAVLTVDEIDMITEVFLEGWRQSGDDQWLRRAEKYAFALADLGTQPWLNVRAAIVTYLAGHPIKAKRLAKLVQDSSGKHSNALPNVKAQLFASLICRDHAQAIELTASILSLTGSAFAQVVPLARLVRELSEAGLPVSADVVEALAPPRVVVFTGHDLDNPDTDHPRFPAASEPQVRHAIVEAITELDPKIGFTTLSAGSSLLFAEVLLEMGRELHIVLPFSIEDVKREDVAFAGEDWLARFDACLERASSVNFATTGDYLGHHALYRFGNQMLHGLATLRAQFLDTEPYLLALWDYEIGSLQGGAADFIDQWGDIARLRLLDLSEIVSLEDDDDMPDDMESADDSIAVQEERQVKVMLFADIVHFSKLSDADLPKFLHAMKRVSDDLRKEFSIDFMASWGDALFVVMDRSVDLCALGLSLAKLVPHYASENFKLPVTLQVRVSLDAGPVYGGVDPFTGRTNYWGFHINRAARLEPVTVPGQVYCSQPFVALLASEESVLRSEYQQEGKVYEERFASAFIGRMALAKNFGEQPVYHLRERKAVSFA